MKTFRLIFSLCALVTVSTPGVGAPLVQAQDPTESIREHYTGINKNVPLYRRVKKNLSGFSGEGGELIAYFHGPSIMKMMVTFYGETGRAVEEYYYWNGKLIFVFRQESRYDKPLSDKVVTKKENRFYFADDKLIRWLDENGKEVASGSNEYTGKQTDYLKTSKQLTEGANSKSPTIKSQ